jgi:hypothetical protein
MTNVWLLLLTGAWATAVPLGAIAHFRAVHRDYQAAELERLTAELPEWRAEVTPLEVVVVEACAAPAPVVVPAAPPAPPADPTRPRHYRPRHARNDWLGATAEFHAIIGRNYGTPVGGAR